MAVFGIDLGVRSVHIARLSRAGALRLYSHICLAPKKVADQSPEERARELHELYVAIAGPILPIDEIYIEEPPLAGGKNPRTFLKLAQVSGVAAAAAHNGGASAVFVPVDTWKKDVIGRGGVSKDHVSEWLRGTYPGYWAQCNRDQNLIDATCIALSRTPAPRSLDQPRIRMAAS